MKKRICIISMAIAFCLTLSAGVWAEEGANTVNLPSPVLSEESINGLPFTDVPEDAWYYSYVQDLFNNKIISGISETKFAPAQNITRAEFAEMASYAADADLSSYTGVTTFTDVPSDAWYAPSVQWANEKGVILGKTDVEFCPDDNINKEEVAVLIYRLAEKIKGRGIAETTEKTIFFDEQAISEWAYPAISSLQLGYVIKGDPNGYLYPQSNITRAEAATLLGSYLLIDGQQQQVENLDELNREMDLEIENYNASETEANGGITTFGFVYAGFQFLDGDILVTTDTSYKGIYGHCGIVVGDKILEIMPASNNHPRLVTLDTWKSRYGKDTTVILRRIPAYCGGISNPREISLQAAWYGKTHYIEGAGKSNTYEALSTIWNTNTANCSSLVYRCYSQGAYFNFKICDKPGNYYIPMHYFPYNYMTYRVDHGFSAIARF